MQIAKIKGTTLRRVSTNMLKLVELCLKQSVGHFQHML
jgi:hypothetical protein